MGTEVLKHKKYIIIGSILLLVFILIILIGRLLNSSKISEREAAKEETPVEEVTPIEATTQPIDPESSSLLDPKQESFQRNETLDQNIPPGAEPSLQGLTQSELQLPEGQPQQFPDSDKQGRGALVVTAFDSGVEVRITTPMDSHSGEDDYFVPANTAPFRITAIPPGYYLVDARKDGYDQSEFIIRVDRDHVTRLQVSLRPLQ